MANDTAKAVEESGWDIGITTNTPYLALRGELRGESCEENWMRFNGTHCSFPVSKFHTLVVQKE